MGRTGSPPRRTAPAICLLLLLEPVSRPAAADPGEYEATLARAATWTRNHPKLVGRHSLGHSREGRDFPLFRIGWNQDDTLPGLYLAAGIHGHENSQRDLLDAVDAMIARADDRTAPDYRVCL